MKAVESLNLTADANKSDPYAPIGENKSIPVCAWCEKEFGIKLPKISPVGGSYTHGICERHAIELMPDVDFTKIQKTVPDMKKAGLPPGAIK